MPGMERERNKAVVGLSGGVDSAVAAAMLRDAGYDVLGLFLRLGCGDAGPDQHAEDAQAVTDALGIPLEVRDAQVEFAPVIEDFVREYAAGRTPNPCARCNVWVKLPGLLAAADELNAAYVATGHYARVVRRDGRAALARAAAGGKDQSYALFSLSNAMLERLLLPLGELPGKEATRARARRLGLPVHEKSESQEICFVPGDDYRAFLAGRAEASGAGLAEALAPGPIEDAAGEVLGEHDGYAGFTVGQRRGLGVAVGEPLYVLRIEPERRAVVIGPRRAAAGRELAAGGAVWQQDVSAEFDAIVQVRYNHAGAPARVRRTGRDRFEARFEEPVHAITPGQAAVAYDGDVLLGGGWIEARS